jgi:enoyl-CoA hydratase/carnithine racemase
MATMNDAPYVLRAQSGGVLTLTLNRGEKFNPLSEEMMAALQAELDAVRHDEGVRVVVLAAAGKAFCAGA